MEFGVLVYTVRDIGEGNWGEFGGIWGGFRNGRKSGKAGENEGMEWR